MPLIEITSHPLCPFSQRLVLVCLLNNLKRGQDFKVNYVGLAQLPGAVLPISPKGELPVLQIDSITRSTTTEHAAEYLDQIAQGKLLPDDPDVRLSVREVEKQADNALNALRGVFTAKQADELDPAFNFFFEHIFALEHALAQSEFPLFRMDTVALAPMFSLVMFFKGFREHSHWTKAPKMRALGEKIVHEKVVKDSLCPDYAGEFKTFFGLTKSVFPAMVAQ
jgi:glutathione S-transferase